MIDDDQNTRTLLCQWLEELGLSGEAENNGHSGLSRLTLQKQRGQIDGIVLDLHMPMYGGIPTLKELRERHQSLPVIVTAEEPYIDEAWMAMRMGAKAFVLKPVNRQDFRQTCSSIFLTGIPL